MPKLLYVTSLSHSGSKLVSLLLGTHPKVFALGEIDIALDLLREKPDATAEKRCSCGEKVKDCATWGARAEEGPER